VAKLIFPKKLMKRMHTVTLEELAELIPPEHLHEEYGGRLKMNGADDWIAFSEEVSCS